MKGRKKILLSLLSVFLFVIASSRIVFAADSVTFILLSQYEAQLNIGESFYLAAVVSDGKRPVFRSSSTRIASVSTYGKVTGKSFGTAYITVKTRNAEAVCRVTVKKTQITLDKKSFSLERGQTVQIHGETSNGAVLRWKSSRKSVAHVNENGLVTAGKPGEAIITAAADQTQVTCRVTVRKPTVALDKKRVSLYRGQIIQLKAEISSGITPKWKSSRSSVALVDENGLVTAVKNGTARITASADGVSAVCEVTVKKPEIRLSTESLTIKAGERVSLKAYVSSGNPPIWSSSKTYIASVDENGMVFARQKGRTYIYAAEDGAKARCIVQVID